MGTDGLHVPCHMRSPPLLRMGEGGLAVVVFVAFDVRLILEVQAVLVGEVVEVGVVAVVREADMIDVAALHEHHFLLHLLPRDGMSRGGIRLVAVHALQLHRLAVEVEVASCQAELIVVGLRVAYLYGAQGNERRQLTNGQHDLTDIYGFDESTETLFYQVATTPLTRDVVALNVKKGQQTVLSTAEGCNDAVFAKGYKYAVLHSLSVTDAGTWTVVDRRGTTLWTVKDNKSIVASAREAGLPVKEFFTFVTERGDTLNGWMIRPQTQAAPKGGYKTLMMQYSGPASQQVLNRWRIDWEEYLAAAEGYLCVCVDPRGTNARGRAFRSLTYMNIGEKEAEDQISAAAYLVRSGLANKDAIALWGWSYGGYATIRTLLHAGSPFTCGIAVAPVTDWRLYDSAYTERYMRRPQVNETGYDNAALMTMVDNINAPLLIVHGLADDNVHVQNSLLLAEAFTTKGKQFEMQLYPDDNHFLRRRSNYGHLYRRMLMFLQNSMK